MSQYFLKLYERSSGNINVNLDLFNYATKANLKGEAGVNTSNLAEKSDLAILKAELDKIDVGKLKTVTAEINKLSNVVDNDAVKKTMCNNLVTKVNAIYASRLASKTQYNTDNISKELSVAIIFQRENQKDCLMNELKHLLHLVTELLQR